jgi:hypothetical protein
MDHSSRGIPLNQRFAGKLSKIIDVHSHAILDIGSRFRSLVKPGGR